MARKPRHMQSENTGRSRGIPLIRYARNPSFLRGIRDARIGRPISLEQSMSDDWVYVDGRHFGTMFPGITTREIKEGREANALEHVTRALVTWWHEAYVSPGIGGRLWEQYDKENREAEEHTRNNAV